MRYFKYDGPCIDTTLLKEQAAHLSTKSQKQRRQVKLLHKLGTAVFFLVGLIVFSALLCLVFRFLPEEDGVFWEIINFLVVLGCVFVALILSALAGTIAAAPLWGKSEKHQKFYMQQLLNEASHHLREYYEFQEPFLVTKCYRSSDRRFDRHDVCIFIVNDHLRICANLHYGFFSPERDLGCYELARQEILIQNSQFKDRSALELQAGDLTFLLGYRAKPFIEKYLSRDT